MRATIELIMALVCELDLRARPNENEHEREETDGECDEEKVLHKSLG
jgi:hypothetical protein